MNTIITDELSLRSLISLDRASVDIPFVEIGRLRRPI